MEYCPIASLQPGFSLLNRAAEKELLPFCADNGIGVLSYGSLGGGVLTGKYTERPHFETKDGMVDPRNRFYPYYSEEAWPHTSRLLEAMRDVAARNNCRVVDVAVGWVLAQRGVTLALVGARTEEQARMNAMAGDFVMPEEDEKMLAEVSAEVLAALNF